MAGFLVEAHVATARPTKRRIFLANIALACAQAIFGSGTVIAQVTLVGMNPVVFALIRECLSGPVLLCLVFLIEANIRVKARDWWRFLLVGLGLFATNFFYIIGLKLAGSTTTAIWQPVQPISVTLLGVLMRYERLTWMKCAGILVAFAGCAFYSLYDVESSSGSSAVNQLFGNVALFGEIVGIAIFCVSQKPLFRLHYSPLIVLGWSYTVASILMAIVTSVVNSVPSLLYAFCRHDCGDGWLVPNEAWIGIGYWVFLGSVAGYFLMTWGNQHVDSSLVVIYTVVQPIMTSVVALLVIKWSPSPHYGLHGLSLGQLGAIPIVLGLSIVIYDNIVHGQFEVNLADALVDSPSDVHASHVVDA